MYDSLFITLSGTTVPGFRLLFKRDKIASNLLSTSVTWRFNLINSDSLSCDLDVSS